MSSGFSLTRVLSEISSTNDPSVDVTATQPLYLIDFKGHLQPALTKEMG